ncbi:2,4-dichlorophenol 6-monooxygenase [Caulobacter segnis]|uniref:Monooxygenase FAD-binding protein n=2 Tax=Caulobacter segnis TaxID=88688 RepID=D5VLX1_CAUST|nr:FAD-dependent monooxygenase [Caulobacter segnis]ADG11494.1 monooxygenase FAD-binding protein [Caulobacter segnis ATCC 21756]AVQ03153.1 2,4-dichlorophenol 6-monooxygenase [Caulobacter segnis]
MQTSQDTTPVLVIGGSLVGLSTALFLAWRGVPTVLVEKHRASAAHPRAIGFTELTLEHFRTVGIADQIPQVAPDLRLRRVTVESLGGAWGEETPWTPGQAEPDKGAASPCTGAAIAQDVLEPILRRAAAERGADLRLGVEMLSFEPQDDRVVVRTRDRSGGDECEIQCAYLIAADGADSPVREQLGIARSGVGHLRVLRSVLFRCEAAEHLLNGDVQQFQIEQPGFSAFLTHYPDGRWVLMFADDAERDASELAASIRRALGRDLEFEILATGRWEMAGRIADRYSLGRVFLAGDAAHQLPPTRGGFGANTGIDDAWNLAWKLQMVLASQAGEGLLETYAQERQPIGWLRHHQTFARPDYSRWVGQAPQTELYGAQALELGQLVRSAAVIGAGPELPPAADPVVWAGQPGVRAPHVWVSRDGARISTHDLLGRGFMLLAEPSDWGEAAAAASMALGVAVQWVRPGVDVIFPADATFERTFGVSPPGACLVRPDGVVGWRSQRLSDARSGALTTALATVLARPNVKR